MHSDTVVTMFPGLDAVELTTWEARGWVRPQGAFYTEIDIARVRLVRDLRYDMGVPEDTLPLVLSLIDQVHGLRHALATLRQALDIQPEPVRQALHAVLQAMIDTEADET